MSREEIRLLAVSKLDPAPASVIYDVGSGTGSVSVELARRAPGSTVFAIEKDNKAAALTGDNARRFGLANIQVVKGEAPEALLDLPLADAIFVGGSGAELDELVKACADKLRSGGRLAATAVTLTKISSLTQAAQAAGLFLREAVLVQLSRAEGTPTIFRGENPVHLFLFEKAMSTTDPSHAESETSSSTVAGSGDLAAARIGTLYGVGVGPGEPELMTLRAHRVLGSVGAVFAPKSEKAGGSLALSIARSAIVAGTPLMELHFPMTGDESVLRRYWDEAADAVLSHLRGGMDAAFVTLGDPAVYSTFGYLARALLEKEPDAGVEYVPGVTSFSAAAARLGRSLVEGGQPLVISPSINGLSKLLPALPAESALVVLKAGRQLPDLLEQLKKEGRIDGAALASRIGLSGEEIVADIGAQDGAEPVGGRDYLTLVIVPPRGNGAPPKQGGG